MRWASSASALLVGIAGALSCNGKPSRATSLSTLRSAPALSASGSTISGKPTLAWSFENETVGQPPLQLAVGITGRGWPPSAGDPPPADWKIIAEPGAPSGAKVLAQLDAATNPRLAVASPAEPRLKDGVVGVRCKLVSGRVEQACGVVLRMSDVDNYYVARASAISGDVGFSRVLQSELQAIASWRGAVATGAWHSLRVAVQRDHFEVFWNDLKVIDARDSTFADAGTIGVWTSADSVTYFDDLAARSD